MALKQLSLSRIWIWTAVIALVVALDLLAGPLQAQQSSESPAEAASKAPADAQDKIDLNQIERLVDELDDDRYDVRQRAELKLEQLGKPALDAVVGAAESGTLESVTRAVNILLHWSEDESSPLRMEVLERVANLPNRPREAAMAARLLANAREREALAVLTKYGAQFDRKAHVHGINNLRIILDKNWKGGSEGLKHLADVPRATTVSLQSAPVDKAVLDEIAKLPSVQRIEVYKTNIPRTAIQEFKKQFPTRDVDHRRGAMLGVVGLPQGQGVVTQVEEGSAAQKAGIQPGDQITKLDGENVDSFQELTEKIGAFEPGETATVTVLRGEETQELKVTFGDMAKSRMMQPVTGGRVQLTPNQIRIIQKNQPAVPRALPFNPRPAK